LVERKLGRNSHPKAILELAKPIISLSGEIALAEKAMKQHPRELLFDTDAASTIKKLLLNLERALTIEADIAHRIWK
jgi:hypothetical protein